MKPTRRDTFLPHIVYRAYAADGTLLYVGCSVDVAARLRQHGRRSLWHPLAVRVEQTRYSNYFTGRAAEAEAIRAESPVCNITGRTVDRVTAERDRDAFLEQRGVRTGSLTIAEMRERLDQLIASPIRLIAP